jgi:NlpC/P60 family
VGGAAGPGAYDCSGLMLAAYRSAGIYLPRVSRAQWYAGPHVGLGELAPATSIGRRDHIGAGAPNRLSGLGGRGGTLLLDCEGRDPRGPTPRSCV